MGFMKKLFGDKREEPPKRPATPPPARPPEPPAAVPPTAAAPSAPPAATAAPDAKQLIRQLGSPTPPVREDAARQLAAMGDRSALRPLMNTYMNYGDPAALEALAAYGATLGPPVLREADDMGLLGPRRARLMDIAGVSGDPDCMKVARDNLRYDEEDALIRVRAAVALARLGDLQGVDELSHDLQMPDDELRLLALSGLTELDIPAARAAITEHLDRYLADAGAVPQRIAISAPRLEDPTANLVRYIAEHVDREPHALTMVIGSEAVRMSLNRRDEILKALAGHSVFFGTPQMPPEEQIDVLRQARDAAAANPEAKAVFVGKIPAPHDSPPLPHFLTREPGKTYTAKMILVDPHELMLSMDWYHYVVDTAEVPTDFEVIMSVSRPGESPISEEEMLIYKLLGPDKREAFVRAYLGHL
jgi:HEAT repeat protein